MPFATHVTLIVTLEIDKIRILVVSLNKLKTHYNIMKKTATLFLLGMSLAINVFAQSSKEIDLKHKYDEENRLRSASILPKVYQENAYIDIKLPSTTTYAIVTITNKVTGEQVYSMVFANIGTIPIDLSADDKGEYIITLTINEKDYSGEFTI